MGHSEGGKSCCCGDPGLCLLPCRPGRGVDVATWQPDLPRCAGVQPGDMMMDGLSTPARRGMWPLSLSRRSAASLHGREIQCG
jgi:hypothetical protein